MILMSAVARALTIAEHFAEGLHRCASALERLARAAESQSGTAQPATKKRKPPALRAVSDDELASAEQIARATGFKVLR